MPYSVELSKSFISFLKEVLKKFPKSRKRIGKQISALAENPVQGNAYPGFGEISVRKMRISLQEYRISKSKGLRLIYVVLPSKEKIVPLVIYKKGKYAGEHEIKNLVIAKVKEINDHIDRNGKT